MEFVHTQAMMRCAKGKRRMTKDERLIMQGPFQGPRCPVIKIRAWALGGYMMSRYPSLSSKIKDGLSLIHTLNTSAVFPNLSLPSIHSPASDSISINHLSLLFDPIKVHHTATYNSLSLVTDLAHHHNSPRWREGQAATISTQRTVSRRRCYGRILACWRLR